MEKGQQRLLIKQEYRVDVTELLELRGCTGKLVQYSCRTNPESLPFHLRCPAFEMRGPEGQSVVASSRHIVSGDLNLCGVVG